MVSSSYAGTYHQVKKGELLLEEITNVEDASLISGTYQRKVIVMPDPFIPC